MALRFISVMILLLTAEGSLAINIRTVRIGDPGNAHDANALPYPAGGVPYPYRIGKFEVTNAEYVEFLNSVDPNGVNALFLYDSAMTTDSNGGVLYNSLFSDGAKYTMKEGREDQPVVFISWFDAIRFANWMHNGQGDTETGAYTLDTLGENAIPINHGSIVRNAGAKWFLPSVDEWHKAAFYHPHVNGGDSDDYWDYPMQSNSEPYSAVPPGTTSPEASITGNFEKSDGVDNSYDNGRVYPSIPGESNLTNVGSYDRAPSYYGTFDQAGNVWELLESDLFGNREQRGGGWNSEFTLTHSRAYGTIDAEIFIGTFEHGFRMAAHIPELSTRLQCLILLFAKIFTRLPRRHPPHSPRLTVQ